MQCQDKRRFFPRGESAGCYACFWSAVTLGFAVTKRYQVTALQSALHKESQLDRRQTTRIQIPATGNSPSSVLSRTGNSLLAHSGARSHALDVQHWKLAFCSRNVSRQSQVDARCDHLDDPRLDYLACLRCFRMGRFLHINACTCRWV